MACILHLSTTHRYSVRRRSIADAGCNNTRCCGSLFNVRRTSYAYTAYIHTAILFLSIKSAVHAMEYFLLLLAFGLNNNFIITTNLKCHPINAHNIAFCIRNKDRFHFLKLLNYLLSPIEFSFLKRWRAFCEYS